MTATLALLVALGLAVLVHTIRADWRETCELYARLRAPADEPEPGGAPTLSPDEAS